MLAKLDRVCDVDLHHTWSSDAELLEYLPRNWAECFAAGGAEALYGSLTPAAVNYPKVGGSAMRLESVPPSGGAPGCDYDLVCSQHLDRYDITCALLTYGFGTQGAFFNPRAAIALCRAVNDWCIDFWLDRGDARLYSAILVPTGDPLAAAEEIRRVASHPRMVGVLMVANPLNRPFGDAIYDPIFDAATEAGLPVITHLGSQFSTKGTMTASGLPTTKPEYYTVQDQAGMHHLTSMLAGGLFERFPSARVLFNEWGFTWVPWIVWALDAQYKQLQREVPALRRPASEYFLDHVWFDTQPFETNISPRRVQDLVDSFDGFKDRLCYASDYPHWDTDPPLEIAARLPRDWRPGVMGDNATRLFDWSSAAAPERPAREAVFIDTPVA